MAILKRRFNNLQLIVNKQMDALLSLGTVDPQPAVASVTKASCHYLSTDEPKSWEQPNYFTTPTTRSSGSGPSRAPRNAQRSTNAMYVDAQTSVLLQTAELLLCNLNDPIVPPMCVKVRAIIMDSGSRRTYVTSREG